MKIKVNKKKQSVGSEKPAKVYRTNMAVARQKAEEVEKGRQDRKGYLEVPEGTNFIRVFPPWGESAGGWPFRSTAQHNINTDDIAVITGNEQLDDGFLTTYCRRAEGEDDCAVCEYEEHLRTRGGKTALKLADKITAKPRHFANAVLVMTKTRSGNQLQGTGLGQPKVWAFGGMIYEDLAAKLDPEAEGQDFTDPDKGVCVIVKRRGLHRNTRYTCAVGSKRVSLTAAHLGKMQDLDALILKALPTYKEQTDSLHESAAFLRGTVASENDDEDLNVPLDEGEHPAGASDKKHHGSRKAPNSDDE